MTSFAQVRTFTEEVGDELQKVTWPDWPQLKNSTVVVIIFVLIVGFIIWLMDVVVSGVLNVILDLFAG